MEEILVHNILLLKCPDLIYQVDTIFKNSEGRILLRLLWKIKNLNTLISYLDEINEYLIPAYFIAFLVVKNNVSVNLLKLLDNKLGLLGVFEVGTGIEEWEIKVPILKHHRVAQTFLSTPLWCILLFKG